MNTIEERIEQWNELSEDERRELADELAEGEPIFCMREDTVILSPWDTCWDWGVGKHTHT